jgi:hypothetical protein
MLRWFGRPSQRPILPGRCSPCPSFKRNPQPTLRGLAAKPKNKGLLISALVPGSYPSSCRSTKQRYRLSANGQAAPLELASALSPSIANAGQSVTLTVVASGGAGAITRSATLDDQALTLDAAGTATFAAPPAGVHRVRISASAGTQTQVNELIRARRQRRRRPASQDHRPRGRQRGHRPRGPSARTCTT